MVYNPVTHKWEGNYDILKNFEQPAGPKLFSPSSYNTPNVVEGMRFNPATKSWRGEKDEEDEFKDIPDLKVKEKNTSEPAFFF